MLLKYLIAAEVVLWAGFIFGIAFIQGKIRFRSGARRRSNIDAASIIFRISYKAQWSFFAIIAATMLYNFLISPIDLDNIELSLIAIVGIVFLIQSGFQLSGVRQAVHTLTADQLPAFFMSRIYFIFESIKFLLLVALGVLLMR